jgi:phytoene dehydrogenase-like protein
MNADAVVIGAGHNGLVAATILADAGWDVVVCEATDVAGGAVRSNREVHPDYISDLFSAFYPLGAGSPVLAKLDLERHGLRWNHAPHPLAHVLPDDRCAVLDRNVDVTAASLDTFSRGDGDAWRRIAQQWAQVSPAILGALFTPFPPVRSGLSLVRRAGIGDALRLARMGLSSVRRYGDENFRGEGGPLLFAGNALHADLSPDSAGSAVYGWLLAMMAQTVGYPVPVGGAGMLASALVSRLKSAGGQLRLNSPVDKVLVQRGEARGVRLRGGEQITARRAVLADVGAPILYRQLVGIDHLSAVFQADLAKFQWDTPTLKLDWALTKRIPWIAQDAGDAGTVHLGADMNGLTRYAADLATATVPTEPLILLGQMTTADKTRSPEGTESAWAYTHLPAGVPATEEVVAEQAARVRALLERHAPGFTASIAGELVQGPQDLQDRNPNLVAGAVGGGTSQLHQQLVFRPTTGLGGADTPIPRLYLAGSSAHPGGGVHGGPGSIAATTALRNEGVRGAVRRRVIKAALGRIY